MTKLIFTCLFLLSGINFVSHVYAADIVVTTTGNVDEIIGNAIALTGATTGLPASVAANSVTNTITTNITTTVANTWLVDIVGSSLNGSFTPDASQTEQSDQQTGTGGVRGGGTAASSTKLIAAPTVNTPMIQTHSNASATNDLVHAIAAVTPTATIVLESTSNGFTSANNNNTFTWTHNFNDSNVDTKLLVGVVVEDRTNACTTGSTLSGQSVEISSITHDGNNLTRIAYQTIRIAIGGADRCLRAELWYLDIDVPPPPISEWRMDEGSWSGIAGEVTDNTGNGFDGTATNGPVTDNTTPAIATDPGTCGYGTFTQSSSQFVNVPYNASLNPDGDFTVAFWARVSGSAGTWRSPITSRWENGGASIRQGYLVYAGTDNNWQFWTGVGAAAWDVTTGPAVTIGAWTHVAITYDSTSVSSGIHTGIKSLYINGVATTNNNRNYQPNTTNPTTIGAGGGTGNSFYFDGDIDEVRIYDSALTSGDVSTIMMETHPCPAVGDITVNF